MRDPNMEEKLKAIENELQTAESAKSYSGEACRWVGLLTATFGTLVALAISYETADRKALLAVAGFLGGGLPLAAIGSSATNNKKTARAALVQARLAKLSYFDPGCDTVG